MPFCATTDDDSVIGKFAVVELSHALTLVLWQKPVRFMSLFTRAMRNSSKRHLAPANMLPNSTVIRGYNGNIEAIGGKLQGIVKDGRLISIAFMSGKSSCRLRPNQLISPN
ncbi:hypothetical protein D8666_20165 [Ochrobactrum soli]|nr:hypothetical protein D8666_20165 [[Ochrobactrum] soli]